MTLQEKLIPYKDEISAAWLEAVNGTYPFNTIGFLRTKSNPFINPVGERNKQAANTFCECILAENPTQDMVRSTMEDFIKVRAVQEFSVEDAIGILLAFKPIVRKTAKEKKLLEASQLENLQSIEANVDALVLMAAAVYSQSREQIAQLRIEEIKRKHAHVIRYAQRMMGEDLSDLLPEKLAKKNKVEKKD